MFRTMHPQIFGGGFSLLSMVIMLCTGASPSATAATCRCCGSRMAAAAGSILALALALVLTMLCLFAFQAVNAFEVFALLYASICCFMFSLLLMTTFRVFDRDVDDEIMTDRDGTPIVAHPPGSASSHATAQSPSKRSAAAVAAPVGGAGWRQNNQGLDLDDDELPDDFDIDLGRPSR